MYLADIYLADVSTVGVQVTPLQQCEASSLNVDCFNCDVAWLATGSCMPGVYAYQYTLTNSEGYSAVPVNVTVQIYEQVSPGLPVLCPLTVLYVPIVLCTWSSVLPSLTGVMALCRLKKW